MRVLIGVYHESDSALNSLTVSFSYLVKDDMADNISVIFYYNINDTVSFFSIKCKVIVHDSLHNILHKLSIFLIHGSILFSIIVDIIFLEFHISSGLFEHLVLLALDFFNFDCHPSLSCFASFVSIYYRTDSTPPFALFCPKISGPIMPSIARKMELSFVCIVVDNLYSSSIPHHCVSHCIEDFDAVMTNFHVFVCHFVELHCAAGASLFLLDFDISFSDRLMFWCGWFICDVGCLIFAFDFFIFFKYCLFLEVILFVVAVIRLSHHIIKYFVIINSLGLFCLFLLSLGHLILFLV